MTAIAAGTLVDYAAAQVGTIAGTVVSIDDDFAMVTEYFADPFGQGDGHGGRPAQTRRMPIDAIRPHRHSYLCDCD